MQNPTVSTKSKGDLFEAKTLEWLLAKPGWRLLKQNFRCKGGEIDLIFEHDQVNGIDLVFVEVRSRSTDSGQLSAFDSITFRKQYRVQMAAKLFLINYSGLATGARFDIVTWEFGCMEPFHLKNAW